MMNEEKVIEAYKKGSTRNGLYLQVDGKYGLIKCPECNQENYALAVNSGICCWCGYNANGGLDELHK